MRRNVIILVLAAIALTVVWFFLLWSPLSSRISDARAAADAADQKVKQLQLEIQRLKDLEKQAPQLQAAAARADEAIPNDPKLARFILDVQAAADSSGVDWMSITPTPPAAPGGAAAQPQVVSVLEVAMNIKVEGGYFQVQDFITRLETMARAVKISGVRMNAGADDPTLLSASLDMRMFVAPPAPAATTTATTQATGG